MEEPIISTNTHYLLLFFRDIYKRKLTLKKTDNEQSKLVNEWKETDRGVKLAEKKIFFKQRKLISWCKRKSS